MSMNFDLAQRPIRSIYRSRRVEKLETALGVRLFERTTRSWCFEARHVSTLLGLVEAGLGVAVVPRLSMPQGEHATLAMVELVEPTVDRTVGLIRRRGREFRLRHRSCTS